MCTGDFISQFAVEKKKAKDYDTKRAGRFFLFGTFVAVSPMGALFFILTCMYHCPISTAGPHIGSSCA